jgi:hypothetical protein
VAATDNDYVSDAPFVVGADRRKAAGTAVWFGLLSWSAGIWALARGQLELLPLLLVLLPTTWWYGRTALKGRIALTIDTGGLTLGRRGIRVAWRDVRAVSVRERQSAVGVDYELIVGVDSRVVPEPSVAGSAHQIRIPLDGVRPSIEAIADAIEARSDLTVDRPERRRRFMRWGTGPPLKGL